MSVSVAIPVYNEIQYIERTLQSVIDNYDDIDEIIIVDNASNDGTSQICLQYAREFKKIKYYCHEKNIGVFKNWCFGLDMATQSSFMWLGGHDLIPPGYIKEMSNTLIKNRSVFAYCRSDFYDNQFTKLISSVNYSDDFKKLNSVPDVYERISFLLEKERPVMLIHGLYNCEVLKKICSEFGNFKIDDEGTIIRLCFEGIFSFNPNTNYMRRYNRSSENFFSTWKRYGEMLYSNKASWIGVYLDFFKTQLRSIKPMKNISFGKYLKLRQLIFERYWFPLVYISNYNRTSNSKRLKPVLARVQKLIYLWFDLWRKLKGMDGKYFIKNTHR